MAKSLKKKLGEKECIVKRLRSIRFLVIGYIPAHLPGDTLPANGRSSRMRTDNIDEWNIIPVCNLQTV